MRRNHLPHRAGRARRHEHHALLVDFNDEVSEGEPLARLDPRTFQSEVRQAEAALEVARAEVLKQRAELARRRRRSPPRATGSKVAEAGVERARAKLTETERDLGRKRALAGTEALAPAHVDQATTANQSAAADLRAAEAEVEVAKEAVVAAEAGRLMVDANLLYAEAAEKQKAAELDQARIDLDATVIAAPIDGVVIGRDVDRGQTVAASLEAPTLFTIAQDLRQMEVHANIDEADIGRSGSASGELHRRRLSRPGVRRHRDADPQGAATHPERGHLHGRAVDARTRISPCCPA